MSPNSSNLPLPIFEIMDLYDLTQYQRSYIPPSKQTSPCSFIPTPPESPKSRKSCSSSRTSRSGRSKSSKSMSPTHVPFDDMHEAILYIIEEAVEKQMTKAMLSFKVQNEDFDGQNETLNQQLGLHQQSIQRQNDIFDSQTKVLHSLLSTTSGMVQTLADSMKNVQQVVSQTVQEETRSTIHAVLTAQHQTAQIHVPNNRLLSCAGPDCRPSLQISNCRSVHSCESSNFSDERASHHSIKTLTARRKMWNKLKSLW